MRPCAWVNFEYQFALTIADMPPSSSKFLALLRGINVGGKNIIAKDDLRQCFERHRLHKRPHVHPEWQHPVSLQHVERQRTDGGC